MDLQSAGFRDIFVVRGDERYSPGLLRDNGSGKSACESRTEGYAHAVDLVAHVASLNAGRYTPLPRAGRRFFQSEWPVTRRRFRGSQSRDRHPAFEGEDRGRRGFVVTQMVFEAGHYAELVRRLADLRLRVSVVPGIKPVLRAKSLASSPNILRRSASGLVQALREARGPAAERAAGIEWAVRLARDLRDAGAPCLHFFTIGRGPGPKPCSMDSLERKLRNRGDFEDPG